MRQTHLNYFEAMAKRNRRSHVEWLFRKFWPFMVIAVLVVTRYLFPEKLETTQALQTPVSSISAQDRSAEAYFSNCAAARAAGVAPITIGEPGYRDGLDGDGDGIACEPFHGRKFRP